MSPFQEPFKNLSQKNISHIIDEIVNQPDEYFDSIPLNEFAEYLISKYSIDDFPEIIWDEIEMDFSETKITGNSLPPSFGVFDHSKKFPVKVVEYHVPIEGDSSLLRFCASNIFSTAQIRGSLTIDGQMLLFSFDDIYNNPEKVEREFNDSKKTAIGKINALEKELKEYHSELASFIRDKINKRVQKINHTNEYKSKFKYPVKKKEVPVAFQSPRIIKKKKIVPKPVGAREVKSNHRYITEEDYMYILGLLQDCGKIWEQHPEIYKGKGEEALRDQLIFVLAPNIEGVVAGEAYNKKGKTDIAIKHESTNLFIGECKIWKGARGFSETIDQILGYLTWRDSKAAVMMFVPNKDISSVRKAAKEAAEKHPNYVRIVEEINEGWTNYRFHLQDDPGTYLNLAVQLYHLPEL